MNFNDIQFPAKPECSYGEVIATDRGWEVLQSSGYSEILVSWPNMKSEMDRIAAKDAEPSEPVKEEVAEPVKEEVAEPVKEEVAEPVKVEADEKTDDEPAAPTKHVYTKEELEAMKMDALRPIGVEFDVRDTSKAELIAKILAAQAAQ